MASCSTSRWASTSPYVTLNVNISSSTATSATLSWSLVFYSEYAPDTWSPNTYRVVINGSTVKNSSYTINGITGSRTITSGTVSISKGTSAKTVSFSVSFDWEMYWSGVYCGTNSASGSISVPAKTSYTVSYNANGGSGAPGSQTKWAGTNLTLSSTKPSRTGYTFLGWATSSGGSVAYQPGGTYSANASVTLYAKWQAHTYTVSYNANGGSGAPGNQTKTYGVTLKLSSTKPTRTNYNFLGWGTSSSSKSVSYAAGANYTANASIALYAVWQLAYVKPRVSNLAITRCNSSGTASSEGTYAKVTFNWSTDRTVSSIKISWGSSSTTVSASGTSGSVSKVVGGGGLSTETSYTITATVSDSGGSSSISGTLTGYAYAIDFRAGGKGAAIGKPAEKDNAFEVGWPIYAGEIHGYLKENNCSNTNFNNITKTGVYYGYTGMTNAASQSICVLEVLRYSDDWIVQRQTLIGDPGYTWERHRHSGTTWTGWKRIQHEKDYLRSTYNSKTVTIGSQNTSYCHYSTTADNHWFNKPVYVQGDVYAGSSYNRRLMYRDEIRTHTLWAGALYMQDGQTATLSESVSSQPHGIVLTFSYYNGSAAQNEQFYNFFVPRAHVTAFEGTGSGFLMPVWLLKAFAFKYLYISNTKIVGHSQNNDGNGSTASGAKWQNNYFVLRFVHGL